jgi:signal peptidase II
MEPATRGERERTTPDAPRWGLVAGVALAVVVLDQATKWWALRELQDQRIIELVWTLQFRLAYNTGAAFSFGAGSTWGRWLPLAALAVVVALLWQGRTARSTLGAVALGLVVGGALGNLADRAFRGDGAFFSGAVVDFIDVQWWPVFNVADMGVVIGGILLVLSGFHHDPDGP